MAQQHRDEEIRTVIPGDRALIPDVCDFVAVAARRGGLNERAVYHCQMSVDEACTNIIEHGFRGGDQQGQIQVTCRNEADRFVVQIIDNSPLFNPLQHGDPNPDTPLSDREPGGWGIFFIKKMMDDVAYKAVDNQNVLTIAKRKTAENLSRPPSAPVEDEGIARDAGNMVWVISPHQRLDSNTAPALQSALDHQIDAGHTRLVVDLSRVTYISTSGLKVLVNAWRKARQQDGDIVLADLPPLIAEVFLTVGFDQVFSIYHATDEAVRHFGGGSA